MQKFGRTTKLTPDVQKEIGQNIILGMPIKFAAEAAGIGETTFYRWMQSGEKAKRGKFREFWEYIKECQAKAVQLHLKLITKAAGEGTWQASAWILERRFPEEFGRREKVDVDANLNHSGKVDVTKMSDEELQKAIEDELINLLAKRESNGTSE